MTNAEERDLFARLGRLERSAWRWRVLASVLAEQRRAAQAERRARMEAEDAAMRLRVADEQRRAMEAEARRRAAGGTGKGAP